MAYFLLTIALIGALLAYLITVPLYLVGLLVPPVRPLADRVLCDGIRLLMSVQPWLAGRIEIDVPARGGCLLVSNHRSHLDAFLILSRVRGVRILAKDSLFRVPFLGLMMRLSGQVPIRRGDLQSFQAAMERMARLLARGDRIHIFPEGTRCSPGHAGTLEFALSPFKLALETGVPVVPIAVSGTDRTWPKGRAGLAFREPITLRTLEPIPSRGFASAEALRDEVRRRIDQALR